MMSQATSETKGDCLASSQEDLDLSAVVPTYNRRELLFGLVDSLRKQSYSSNRYEIVIVSDGSTDGTDDLYEVPMTSPTTRLVRQDRRGQGQGAARNLGCQVARGKVVLFLDDDMIADERLVEMHVMAHSRLGGGIVVLGRSELPAELCDTPFRKTIVADGCRVTNSPSDIEGGFVSFTAFVSRHISIRRSDFLALGGYDEHTRAYGWGDLEIAYRAAQKGMQFYYYPDASGVHRDQKNTLETQAKRLRDAARMAPVLFSQYPELKPLVPMYVDKSPIEWRRDGLRLALKKATRRLIAVRPLMGALEATTPIIERTVKSEWLLRRWYYGVLGGHVLTGYREGLSRMAAVQNNCSREQ